MDGWGVALQDAASLPLLVSALGRPVNVLAFDADVFGGLRCEVEGEGIGRR